MKYFLSIAASDSSSGAGIQQDNAVAQLLGFFPLNVITAITAQNFHTVYDVFSLNKNIVFSQLNAINDSFNISCSKIGVLTTLDHIDIVSDFFSSSKINSIIKVVDTVFASSSGWQFLDKNFINVYKNKILPLATFITPNKNELEYLCNEKLETFQQAINQALKLHEHYGCGIFLKGGHFQYYNSKIQEALIFKGKINYIYKKRRNFIYTHGTGCAFSSAFACYLALEKDPIIAAKKATNFVSSFFKKRNKLLKDQL